MKSVTSQRRTGLSARYSIKDLERMSGIKAHTLRIWEQRYNILRPERSATNIRSYTAVDLRRILNISMLVSRGYRISAVAKLGDEGVLREVQKLLGTYEHPDDQVNNLLLCLMDLDEERFETVLANCISRYGFENAYEQVVFPFLREVGNKWQLGIVSPAQEHYMSNLIRQKLITGIDRLSALSSPKGPRILFFLPDQELHEIGLLYSHYIARALGYRCIYLGQCVPLEDLLAIASGSRPDFAVTILTSPLANEQLEHLFKTLSAGMPGCTILLGGRVLFHDRKNVTMPSSKFKLFADYHELRRLLDSNTG